MTAIFLTTRSIARFLRDSWASCWTDSISCHFTAASGSLSFCTKIMYWLDTLLSIRRYLSSLFYRVDAMHSADYALARCLSVRRSVCLSVTRRYCVETAKHILRLFSPSGSYTVLVFPCPTFWQYFDGTLWRRRRMQGLSEKNAMFDQYQALSQKWHKIHRVSKRPDPWPNFTSSQLLLISFGRDGLYSILYWLR